MADLQDSQASFLDERVLAVEETLALFRPRVAQSNESVGG